MSPEQPSAQRSDKQADEPSALHADKQADKPSAQHADKRANGQAYELRPDWKVFLIPYIAGVLLAPLAGLGIYIIYRYWSRWKSMRYMITNSEVIHQHGDKETIALLHDIASCEVSYSRLTARFGIGTITIRHTAGSMELNGITDPEPVAEVIERAAAGERERMKMREEAAQYRPAHPSGTLDKKNELVGLWQQGLISEEDYQQELKKFE